MLAMDTSWTLEELATETGLAPRTIRSYIERGLLPGPATRGRGARYGDTVQIVCWVDRLNSRGLRFAYEARRGSDLLATGATEHVWVEAATGKIRRMPEELRKPFEELAGRSS